MKFDLHKKRMPLDKFLNLKGAGDRSPMKTRVLPDKSENKVYPVNPNKDGGSETSHQEKQEVITVYSVKPKSLKKVSEIWDKDAHEKNDRPIEQARSVNAPNPKFVSGDPQALIKMIVDDVVCQDLPAVLERLERLEGLSDDVWERITDLLANFSSGIALYDKGVFLEMVSEWAQTYPLGRHEKN
ncbi:MAG: hypothetical protein ABFS56_19400 [Pseudomonadota bacterium]